VTRNLAAARLLVGLAVGVALVRQPAAAQSITIDGTLSPPQTLLGPNYLIGANLGRQVGANLFQSFGIFGLNAGESATFTGPAGIANIIGRVTGGSPSAIDGLIRSTIAGANLFLINPFGIVFGPNATVNVSGSFHASTADYLRLADGALFKAVNPNGSTLSAAPPAAFGFLTSTPAPIGVYGSSLGAPGLELVGGPVTITSGTLTAPSGMIHIASAAGPGEIPIDPTQPASVTAFGPVAIGGGAALDVTGGGSVFIRAGTLSIDASRIESINGAASGGDIVLQADSSIALGDGAAVLAMARGSGGGADVSIAAPAGAVAIDASRVLTGTTGSGSSGNLTISAANLTLTDAAAIDSETSGAGNAGAVTVAVTGALSIDGAGNAGATLPGIGSVAGASGNAGAVTVTAGSLTLTNYGAVRTVASGSGSAGDVSVAVAGALTIDGGNLVIDENTGVSTGISSWTLAGSSGDTGNVGVTAGSIAIASIGGIGNITQGSGNTGSVRVDAAGALSIIGTPLTGHFGFFTGITSQTGAGSTGAASDVTVDAGSLTLLNKGEILSTTFGAGPGGNVVVNVAGALVINGFAAGIFANAEPGSTSPAGDVTVNAGTVSVLDQGEIASDTFGSGNAGQVTVTAGQISLASEGTISSSTFSAGNGGNVTVVATDLLSIVGPPGNTKILTGITSESNPGSTGNAGSVAVTAGGLSLADHGEISSATFGTGNGGSVTVMVTGLLSIVGPPGNTTFLTGITSDTDATGNAGEVIVVAGQLALADTGAAISSSTLGSGRGGSVSVSVSGLLSISGVAGVFAISGGKHSGNAGDVAVTAGEIAISSGGEIAASTYGSGSGGDVVVTVADGLTIDGTGGNPHQTTGILSAAKSGSTGNAGQVTVSAGTLLISAGGAIASTTSGAGNAGLITVTVAGQMTIDGRAASAGQLTGISSSAEAGTGDAGEVQVTAASLTILANGEIASGTFSSGNGGNVVVDVAGLLSIGADPSSFAATGIVADTDARHGGNAGTISVTAGALTINEFAAISSSTFGFGNAGSVNVTVAGQLTIEGGGPHFDTGILSEALAGSSGNGGSVTVSAGSLDIGGYGEISSRADPGNSKHPTATGAAGQVVVSVGALTITGHGSITTATSGPGQGGDIDIVAGTIGLSGPHARITAQSTGSGAAGSIELLAGTLRITDGASISTAAAAANGGNITLTIGNLLYLQNGDIVTASFGAATGNGGNITIRYAPLIVLRDASRIDSSAVGGNGGNISIDSGSFIATPDSVVDAHSQEAISGTIEIEGPRVDLNGSLVTLPGTLQSPEAILRTSCAARSARPQSSLVPGSRGGLPISPNAALPSLYLAPRAAAPAHGSALPVPGTRLRTGLAATPDCSEERL
jgi:filamentous hemagglutinin family protein